MKRHKSSIFLVVLSLIQGSLIFFVFPTMIVESPLVFLGLLASIACMLLGGFALYKAENHLAIERYQQDRVLAHRTSEHREAHQEEIHQHGGDQDVDAQEEIAGKVAAQDAQ